MSDLSNDREEVVAAVECTVRDPGDLTGYLGIAKEAKLRIETLSTGSSTVLVQQEAYFTGFPALLSFKNRKFSFEGTEISESLTSVSIDIQGNFGSRSQGEFLFYFKDPSQEALGSATLSDCARVL